MVHIWREWFIYGANGKYRKLIRQTSFMLLNVVLCIGLFYNKDINI